MIAVSLPKKISATHTVPVIFSTHLSIINSLCDFPLSHGKPTSLTQDILFVHVGFEVVGASFFICPRHTRYSEMPAFGGSDSDSDATKGSDIFAGVEAVPGADAVPPSGGAAASPIALASPASPAPASPCFTRAPLPPGACLPPSSPIPTQTAESTLSCIIVIDMCADVVL